MTNNISLAGMATGRYVQLCAKRDRRMVVSAEAAPVLLAVPAPGCRLALLQPLHGYGLCLLLVQWHARYAVRWLQRAHWVSLERDSLPFRTSWSGEANYSTCSRIRRRACSTAPGSHPTRRRS